MQNNLQVKEMALEANDDGRYFRTIGEVSAELKISPHVLRFWESKFQIIKPHKRRGGHRYYSQLDVEKISEIKTLLYDKGFTIKGAQRHLKDGSKTANTEVFEDTQPDEAINETNSIMQSTLFDNIEENQTDNQTISQEQNKVINFRGKALDKTDKKLIMLFIKELETIKNILQSAN